MYVTVTYMYLIISCMLCCAIKLYGDVEVTRSARGSSHAIMNVISWDTYKLYIGLYLYVNNLT